MGAFRGLHLCVGVAFTTPGTKDDATRRDTWRIFLGDNFLTLLPAEIAITRSGEGRIRG